MDHTWFVLAIASPFLWSLCNHIDKHLLSKYFEDRDEGVGALMIVSALASVIATPFLFIADSSVMDIGAGSFWIIATTALLDVLTLWAYLKAMQRDDASNVILYYQLVPVLGIIAGYVFLGEIITRTQLIAMSIIILGTSIVSFANVEGKFHFKKHTVGFMLLACSCWAAELAIFKVAALEENALRSMFWKHVVLVVIGLFMFMFVPGYRTSFLKVMQCNSVPVLGLNLLNECLYMLGTITYGFAVVLAPVALVLLTEAFQSIFVFLIAVTLVCVWPNIATEDIRRYHVQKKMAAITVTCIGTYFLLSNGVG